MLLGGNLLNLQRDHIASAREICRLSRIVPSSLDASIHHKSRGARRVWIEHQDAISPYRELAIAVIRPSWPPPKSQ